MLRRSDAGNYVFTLSVDQVFSEEPFFTRGRVAGKGYSGSGIVPHVAKHHCLDIDGCAPADGNVMQAPVGYGANILPRAQYRTDSAP